jgi:hypothetical protein
MNLQVIDAVKLIDFPNVLRFRDRYWLRLDFVGLPYLLKLCWIVPVILEAVDYEEVPLSWSVGVVVHELSCKFLSTVNFLV